MAFQHPELSSPYVSVINEGYARILQVRDPNDGQSPLPSSKARHQYVVAGGQIWYRKLPPESVGDTYQDSIPTWEPRERPRIASVITAWADQGDPVPMVVMARLPFYKGNQTEFCIAGQYRTATEEQDVYILAGPCTGSWAEVPVPSCPDCGGEVVWAEAGSVPGARQCTHCESMFTMLTVSQEEP